MSGAPLVVCVVAAAEVESVSLDAFEAGATAVEERERADGRVELRMGFETLSDAERARGGLPVGTRLEIVNPEEWVESQRPWIDPTRVGPFEIVAPWLRAEVERRADHRIVIDPGGAFGHGGHPSTRLVLRLLPELVSRGTYVIDVGTGTGVLAIAAAVLGATVVAIDSDPVAIATARRNVEQNGVADMVTVELADIGSQRPQADVALVNVTVDGHRVAAPALADTPVIAASGTLRDQLAVGRRLYEPRVLRRRLDEGEWSAAILEPPKSEGPGA